MSPVTSCNSGGRIWLLMLNCNTKFARYAQHGVNHRRIRTSGMLHQPRCRLLHLVPKSTTPKHSDRISMLLSHHSWAYQNISPTFPPLNTMSNSNIPSCQPSPFRNLNNQPPSHWLSLTPNPPPTNQSATQNLQQTSHPIISSSDLQ